jgi:hypothetical protein
MSFPNQEKKQFHRRMKRGPAWYRPAMALICVIAVSCACIFFSQRPTVQAAGKNLVGKNGVQIDVSHGANDMTQANATQDFGKPPAQMSLAAARQVQALQAEKAARTPAQRKMDSNLLYAARMAAGKEIAPGVTKLETGIEISDGMVRVDIRTRETEDVAALVKKLGGQEIRSFTFAKSVNARLPISQLETLAGDARVLGVTPIRKPELERVETARPQGNATPPAGPEMKLFDAGAQKLSFGERRERVKAKVLTALATLKTQRSVSPTGGITIPGIRASVAEGDIRHRARAARAAFNVDGTGLRIGILSDSFDNNAGYAADIASGELPGPGNPNGFTLPVSLAGSGDLDSGGIDEGRAMAQIIHAIAPGAQLFFATAVTGLEDFANNILALRGISPNPGPFGNVPGGCDIIVDDIAPSIETPLHDGQTGSVVSQFNMALVQQAVNDVTADGALYFASGGNSGNLNDNQSGAWEGDFTSAGPAPGPLAGLGTALNWTPGTGMMTPFNTLTQPGLVLFLHWSDPLGASSNDYDLFALNADGSAVIGASTLIQDGSGIQDPVEAIATPPVGSRIVILLKDGGSPRFLSFSTIRGRLQIGTDGQARGHDCAANAFGVGATPTLTTVGPSFPAPFSNTNMVETFSSDGLRRIFFAPDGSVLGNGQLVVGSGGGGILRQKPDITAADGAPTTVLPIFARFFGTSAAAPHACAIAALVMAAFIKNGVPNPTPAQVRTILQNTALDIEAPGADRDSGVGILQAFQAVQATGVAGGAGIDFGTVMATEGAVSNNNGFVEPGETANMTVQLSNLGIADATNVTATIVSLTPGVTVLTPNARSYGSIAQNANVTNAVPFAFALTSGASCGANADFALTVNFSGGASGASPRVIRFRVPTGRTGVTVTTQLDGTAPAANPSFTATTGMQIGRTLLTGVASSCAAPKPNPGLTRNQPTAPRRFDAYTFMNTGPARCVTVNLRGPNATPPSGATNFIQSAAYSVFTPATPNTGYLGDGGDATLAEIGDRTYSFTAPANAPFTVTVLETNPGGVPASPATANTYTLTVSGLSLCQPAGVAQQVVNQMSLVMAANPQVVAPTCGAQGFSNDVILNATVTNTGATAVQTVAFQVVELREANGTPPAVPFRLISADGASCTTGGSVGAIQSLTLPAALLPGQSAPVQFRIAAPAARRFRFIVNVLGIDTGVTASAAKRTPTHLGNLALEVNAAPKSGALTVTATTRPVSGRTFGAARR